MVQGRRAWRQCRRCIVEKNKKDEFEIRSDWLEPGRADLFTESVKDHSVCVLSVPCDQ